MNPPLFQLDLFGGPMLRVEAPVPLPEQPPLREEPPPVLPGQLDLLACRAVRLAPIAELLRLGEFGAAAAAATAMRGEAILAAALESLARLVARASSPTDLAMLTLEPETGELASVGASTLAGAVRRGQAAAVARRLDAAGPLERATSAAEAGVDTLGGDGSSTRGRLAGHFWLQAGRPADALASSARSLEVAPALADALVTAGNAHAALAEHDRARDCFRRALRCDPARVRLSELADPALQALALEAEELELHPPEPWLPFVGLLTGVFPMSPEVFEREPTPADRFARALQHSRSATARRASDIEARRELKRLAPRLFARLLDAGLL